MKTIHQIANIGKGRKQHTLWKQRFLYAGKILSLVTTKQGVAGLIQRIF
jgi:hypothetical protein